jgi:hypothetical protein
MMLLVLSSLFFAACGGAGNRAETTVETQTLDQDDADLPEDRD